MKTLEDSLEVTLNKTTCPSWVPLECQDSCPDVVRVITGDKHSWHRIRHSHHDVHLPIAKQPQLPIAVHPCGRGCAEFLLPVHQPGSSLPHVPVEPPAKGDLAIWDLRTTADLQKAQHPGHPVAPKDPKVLHRQLEVQVLVVAELQLEVEEVKRQLVSLASASEYQPSPCNQDLSVEGIRAFCILTWFALSSCGSPNKNWKTMQSIVFSLPRGISQTRLLSIRGKWEFQLQISVAPRHRLQLCCPCCRGKRSKSLIAFQLKSFRR